MNIFRKKMDIGKVITDRVGAYPVFKKEPKHPPLRWVMCPDFKISLPANKGEYEYVVSGFSESSRAASIMLNDLLYWGNKDIEASDLKFWLHAVKHSICHVKGKPLFRADIKYIFRVEEIQEEILQEVK